MYNNISFVVMQASLFQRVTVKHHPELIRLAAPNEDLSEFLRVCARLSLYGYQLPAVVDVHG